MQVKAGAGLGAGRQFSDTAKNKSREETEYSSPDRRRTIKS